ncbi:MAG: rRNA maturation RNase YbeY [Lachnospiraceae bacterium]|nr:rRNA maturation RNase YbeY [Lachnospiraceae bacterium]
MSVYFDIDTQFKVPDNYKDIVMDIIEASLDYLKCPYDCEVNVLFTDNSGIHAINKEQRNIDLPTDVLSFPMLEFETAGDFSFINEAESWNFNPDSGELLLGDIVLNVNRIEEQAERYGHTRRRELAFLTAHSMLHLSGFDHMEDDERLIMENKQEEILNMKGYTRDNEKE